MCEASVYLIKNGSEKIVMENLDIMKPEGENIYFENIFGEKLEIKARIKEMNLVDHRILLVEN
ncbi:MAG: CooT family nickel-binding protein [Deltaproteobacteria bacterium]|nr:CooT family nickel-binding protein [Deltaproteobacteria bacterium]